MNVEDDHLEDGQNFSFNPTGEDRFIVNPLSSFWSSEHSEYVLSIVNEPCAFGAIPFCLLCVKPESPILVL